MRHRERSHGVGKHRTVEVEVLTVFPPAPFWRTQGNKNRRVEPSLESVSQSTRNL